MRAVAITLAIAASTASAVVAPSPDLMRREEQGARRDGRQASLAAIINPHHPVEGDDKELHDLEKKVEEEAETGEEEVIQESAKPATPTLVRLLEPYIVKSQATILHFEAAGLVNDEDKLPVVQVVAPGAPCDTAAVWGGHGTPVTYVSAHEATVTLTMQAPASINYGVCFRPRDTMRFVELDGGHNVLAITEHRPAHVVSSNDTVIPRGELATLHFNTTDLGEDASRPFIKLVASDKPCSADAISGGEGEQLTYLSETEGSLDLTITARDVNHAKLCYAGMGSGQKYIELSGGSHTVEFATKVQTEGITSAQQGVAFKNVLTVLHFDVVNGRMDSPAPFVKFVPHGESCDHEGANGGAASQTQWVSDKEATLAVMMPDYGSVNVCYTYDAEAEAYEEPSGNCTILVKDAALVVGVKSGDVGRGSDSVLRFDMMDFTQDKADCPFVKIVGSHAPCNASAIHGGEEHEVEFVSNTEGKITVKVDEADGYRVCYRPTGGTRFVDLVGGEAFLNVGEHGAGEAPVPHGHGMKVHGHSGHVVLGGPGKLTPPAPPAVNTPGEDSGDDGSSTDAMAPHLRYVNGSSASGWSESEPQAAVKIGQGQAVNKTNKTAGDAKANVTEALKVNASEKELDDASAGANEDKAGSEAESETRAETVEEGDAASTAPAKPAPSTDAGADSTPASKPSAVDMSGAGELPPADDRDLFR